MASKTNTEIEIKLRVENRDDLLRRLAKIHAKPTERQFEQNTLYDTPDGLFRGAGRLLRLRIETSDGGKRHALLTSKAPAPPKRGGRSASKHKEKLENEVDVRDPAKVDQLFRRMDLHPTFRYEKYRTRYNLGSLHLDLDDTPVGTFLELEGKPRTIDRVAKVLGYSHREYIRGTYWDLFVAERRRRRLKMKNMLFPSKNRVSRAVSA